MVTARLKNVSYVSPSADKDKYETRAVATRKRKYFDFGFVSCKLSDGAICLRGTNLLYRGISRRLVTFQAFLSLTEPLIKL